MAITLVAAAADSLPCARPDFEKRTFHSNSIDKLLSSLKPLFKTENLATLFSNTLPNTLDTTVKYFSPNASLLSAQELDSFIITGDIDALWLRDSMNQG